MNKNASEEILRRFLLSELLPKFLPHIARTVHEKALRDRVYQKGEYEVRRKSAVRAVGMFLLAALAILILKRTGISCVSW